MPRRTPSLISLATVDLVAEVDRDEWLEAAQARDVEDTSDEAEAAASLCNRCQNFDIQSFARSPSRRRGYLLKDVEMSARDGCEFCSLLLDGVKDVERPTYFYTTTFNRQKTTNPDLYVHMTVSESYRDDKASLMAPGLRANRLFIQLGDRFSEVRNQSEHEICLAADPSSPAALNEDIIGRCFGGHPSSELYYETARNWIQACLTHSKCNETVSGSTRIDPYFSPLPTRVIEVTREGGRQRPYLRYTEGLHGAYITLTHRWNDGTELCKTTTENYEERLLGGEFGELPQLFWDALVITERLGIKYIWIDSICIIQKGDDADWGREAPKMAQYYQFSIFTLAGTAEDMSNGILHQQPKDITSWVSNLVRLPYRDKMNALAGHFYVYRRRMSLVDEYISQVRSSILFKRGWILQEWLLSKRLLWYTPHGLFYECQQELPRAYDQSQLAFNRANPDLRAHLQLKASFHFSNTNILNFWYHALEVYSGQHLTKPEKDRIMALSGLAKEVGPTLAAQIDLQNEIYVAGLWLRDLHYGLLWEQDHIAQAWTTKIEEAPSWSFASLMTLVRWPERAKGTQSAFKLNGVCLRRQEEHDNPDHFVFGNHRLRPANAAVEMAQFNPENFFSCLHLRGKLHSARPRIPGDRRKSTERRAFNRLRHCSKIV